jgi:hypothetical protein
VDNAFLIIKSWRLAVDDHAKKLTKSIDADRVFVYAVTDVSISLLITSLTDGLSFAVGTVSDFIAVRVFCTYCALAILYMFIFQITLLNGLMVFHCRREILGLHCFLFTKIASQTKNDSYLYTLFCGRRQRVKKDVKINHLWINIAKLMHTKLVRFITLILYIGYLCCSFHYLSNLPLGKKNYGPI